MKNRVFVCFLMLVLFSCQQEAGKTPDTKAGTPATVEKDTVVGMEGSETAKFDGTTYTYAAAKVKVTPNNVGETIEVNGTAVPGQEADFFMGVYKNFLLIDNGTGPNGRKLKVWSIEERKVVFETPYEGDLHIKDDKLNFVSPVDLAKTKLAKPVNCPDAANWKKEGLEVGYGIPSAYDFATKAASATGDVICFAVQ